MVMCLTNPVEDEVSKETVDSSKILCLKFS